MKGEAEPLSAELSVYDLRGGEDTLWLLPEGVTVRLIGSAGDEIVGQQVMTEEPELNLLFLDLDPTQYYRFNITEEHNTPIAEQLPDE